MTDAPNDFLPVASWRVLRLRAALLERVRRFFDERGFLEVETPLLSADVVVDHHLDPFETLLLADPRRPHEGRRMFLQTSPEFCMKRLLAATSIEPQPAAAVNAAASPPNASAAEERPPSAIFQITRAFRNGEIGRLHNPEFTLIEWYRVGDTMHDGMGLLSEMCQALLAVEPAEMLSYAEAFQRHVGIDPHTAAPADLAAVAAARGVAAPASLGDDRDAWLDLLLVELVEPNLGHGRPTILFDYPASQAALAQVRDQSPPVGERFELYVRGIELANGYHELLDPEALRARNRRNNALRAADGKPALPEHSRLLAAMQRGLPPCTGCALGFDRVAMLAVGAGTLAEVLAFPIDRA